MLRLISLPISLWVTLTAALVSTLPSPLFEPSTASATCSRNAGLVLPQGFCAVLVGQGLGSVRHIAVAPNGDIFAAVMSGGSGAVVVLRDTSGDAVADVHKWFGSNGGSGIALHNGYLYFATDTRVMRWRWAEGQLEPKGDAETIVNGLPNGGHAAKSLAFLGGDTMIVNIGSATNSCQREDRHSRSPGLDPCPELKERAGLWQFSADRTGQRQSDGARFATGIRNGFAIGVDPASGKLYDVPHGRDQLAQNWGFTDQQGAELPSEELLQPNPGDDFGWPYCYYDQQQGKLVLAPEYGGDGKRVGQCAAKKGAILGFPGHWAPMSIAFHSGNGLSPTFAQGIFIAFHGSWNRAPLPQAGYRVVFLPFKDGKPAGDYLTFAVGSGGPTDLRATGLAVGPDGSLYLSDDHVGKIWRVMAQ